MRLTIGASIFMMVSVLAPSLALATCNADSNVLGDCLDEFENAAKATVGTDNDTEKAQSAGKAVGNCIQCASETMSDQMRSFAPDSSQGDVTGTESNGGE